MLDIEQFIKEFFNESADGNLFNYSLYSLLIFVLLLYFYVFSKVESRTDKNTGNGLIYLAVSYLLYFIMGIIGLKTGETKSVNGQIFLTLSGLIAMCKLKSLPFFSMGSNVMDKTVNHPKWRDGVTYLGFLWIFVIVLTRDLTDDSDSMIFTIDKIISSLAPLLIGIFMIRYFSMKRMHLMSVITAGLFFIIILLEINPPDDLKGGKFEHMSSLLLAPALGLSIVYLVYTFNWINELNFYELSRIWTGDVDETPDDDSDSETHPVLKKVKENNKENWLEKIAEDKLEEVIEGILLHKKLKNQSIESILNIASRNTRNNNQRLKGLIKDDEYQLNRNNVLELLMNIINGKV